ncbi:hypothetical protein KIL84_006596, partial [Mauremys mutica]
APASQNQAVSGKQLVSGRIFGGQDAKAGAWPWQVSVQINGFHICGGSLISESWVVSAAHCFAQSGASASYRVQLGENQIFGQNRLHAFALVKRIILHPSYNNVTHQANIALVELKNPIAFTAAISPVGLLDTSVHVPAGDACWVTGWGYISPQSCGKPLVSLSGRILNGQDAKAGAWPWQVSVQRYGSHICGGSLISESWVVSAAHCFDPSVANSSYRVQLGENRIVSEAPTQMSSSVKRVVPHPNYNSSTFLADIALVELEKPIAFTASISPVCLLDASVRVPAGDACWVTGWGNIRPQASSSLAETLQELEVPTIDTTICNNLFREALQKPAGDNPIQEDMMCAGHMEGYKGTAPTLQEVQVQLIDTAACNALYNINLAPNIGREPVKPDMICAGYAEGQRDSCQGDSGGPLACDHNGTWFLMGIVSWGYGCGQPNHPGVYVRMVAYGEWIWEHIGSGSQASTMGNCTSGTNDARPCFSSFMLLFTTLLISL